MSEPLSIFAILERQDVETEGGRFFCTVPADFIGFEGHFVGMPVVPGVCQVHWAVEAAGVVAGITPMPVRELEAVKFHNLLTPGTSFVVEVHRTGKKWRYSIGNDQQPFATGRIVPR